MLSGAINMRISEALFLIVCNVQGLQKTVDDIGMGIGKGIYSGDRPGRGTHVTEQAANLFQKLPLILVLCLTCGALF